jgi:peptidoglycan/xylan/chitin deacetylase (PgdA/CDA1 family)
MTKSIFAILTITLCLAALATLTAGQAKPQRTIAITIDDLPVVSTRKDLKTRQEITRKLLQHIAKAKIPAIGFVNENKLYTEGKRDEAQVDLLRSWMSAGLELGNHTYWHNSLHSTALDAYESEILQGEAVIKELMSQKGKTVRYFRHPYLQTGLTLEIKEKLNAFLKEHNYTIAPVTIDNSDWIFARAYDNAFDKKDPALMQRIGAAYVPYMLTKMDYWEKQSVALFNREPAQILLLHANFINSDYLDDLAKMLTARGYKFVSLETALKDPAYLQPDTFTGRAGISWLHRWALAKGRESVLPDEPKVPDFVMKEAGVTSE